MEWLMGSPPVLDCSVLALVAVDLPGVLSMGLSMVGPHHCPLVDMPWCAHEDGWKFVVLLFVVQSSYHPASLEYPSSSWHFKEAPAQCFWRHLVLACRGEHINISPVGAGWFLDNTGVLFFPAFLLSFLLGVAAFSSRSPKTVCTFITIIYTQHTYASCYTMIGHSTANSHCAGFADYWRRQIHHAADGSAVLFWAIHQNMVSWETKNDRWHWHASIVPTL